MQPQWPFKKYTVTQGFENTASRYPVRHGALDIVPLDQSGRPYPAPIFPVLSGNTRYYEDANNQTGRAISVDTELDKPFVDYLKNKDYVPKNFAGSVHLIHLYLHCLSITDKDGHVDQDQSIAVCGNTGMVYSGNPPVPVPPEQKGKPPYPGLHTHLQMVLYGGDNPASNTFNLDKDPQGRIDPLIILNYKGANVSDQIITQAKGPERRIVLKCATEAQYEALCEVYGKDPSKIDENV
jgi:hypothetical protein